MIKKICALVLLSFVFVLPAFAFAIDGSIYTAGVSRYLWRGLVLNDGPAIQSGVSFASQGATVGVWTSCQQMVSPDLFDEIDLTAAYEHSIPYADFLTLGVGYVSYFTAPYNYPNIVASQEYSVTLKSDIISSPYVTFYHSLDAATTYNYLEAGLSYEYETGELLGGKTAAGASGSLGFGLNEFDLDAVTLERTEASKFTAAGLNLYFNYEIAGFKITPSAFFQLSLNDTKDESGARVYKNMALVSIMANYDFKMGTEDKTDEKATE